MSNKIFEIDTSNRNQINSYLTLPYKIYNDIPQWVPPLESDAKLILNRFKHPYFHHSDAAFYLAVDSNGYPIGRLAVQDPKRYNDHNHTRLSFFCQFECKNEKEVAKRLFEAGIEWARSKNLEQMIGPKGFTVFDGYGLLIEGFEHRPAFGLPYNPSYYPELIEFCGFTPDLDIASGYLDSTFKMPEKIMNLANMIKKRRGLSVQNIRNRKELKEMIPKFRELYNSTLGTMSGNAPLTDEEVKTMADQMLWFADPKLIKIVVKDNNPVGFLLAYPDISAAIQRCKGKILPFGWLDMLIELRHTKWININGAGMVEGYRGIGGTAILFSEMYKSVAESHYCFADIVQIGLENEKMQRELRDLGINFYKKHRTYKKKI